MQASLLACLLACFKCVTVIDCRIAMASARFTADGLLDAAQCAELCFIQRSQRRAGYMTGLSTVTFRELLSEPTLLEPLVAARSKVLEAVEEATGEILYVEYTGLNCWDSDAIIEPHYDSNRPYLETVSYTHLTLPTILLV